MKTKLLLATSFAALLGMSSLANAGAMSCISAGDYDAGGNPNSGPTANFSRTWDFNSADDCGTGEGNPNAADVTNLFGGTWDDLGTVTSGGNSSSYLTVALTSGTWGSKPVAGTWSLTSNFWTLFAKAVFTVHVGNAQPDEISDFGAFLITPKNTSGTWGFSQSENMGGGGLSNVRLWAIECTEKDDCEPPTEVPEPGILWMLGSALLGLGVVARKRKA